MNREPTETVREQLENSRQRALAEAEERRREIYSRCPGLYELDRQQAQAAMEIASAAMAADGQQAVEDIRRRIQEIQRQKADCVAAQGYTLEELQPRYGCQECGDTGYVRGMRCSCWHRLYQQAVAKRLPACALDGQCSFGSFRLDYYPEKGDGPGDSPRQTMTAVLERCRQYAHMVGKGAGNLLFVGRTGLGKTHLSLAIAAEAAARGEVVLYSSAQGIVDRFERTRFGRNPTPQDWEFTGAVTSTQLLVIDDLGSEFITAFSQSLLYNIINDRMMAGLETIISTNLEPQKLASVYEQRIASRLLCGYTALGFVGKDIRLLQRTGGDARRT